MESTPTTPNVIANLYSNESKCYNEEIVSVDTDANDNKVNFQTDLNVRCQILVLKYLGIKDLLAMAKTNLYFLDLIQRFVVEYKEVNLNFDIEAIAKFGKFIRKVRVNRAAFEFLIPTIFSACSCEEIKELRIDVSGSTIGQHQLCVPNFIKLQKLTIETYIHPMESNQLLQQLVTTATKLKHLKIESYYCDFPFSIHLNVVSLLSLTVHSEIIIDGNSLVSLLRNNVQLELLSLTPTTEFRDVGLAVIKYSKNLQHFHYEDHIGRSVSSSPNTYSFIHDCRNLSKYASLCRDAVEVLSKFPPTMSIGELRIITDFSTPNTSLRIDCNKSALNVLNILIIIKVGNDLTLNVVDRLLDCVPNNTNYINSVHLTADRQISGLDCVFKHYRKIKTLDISNVSLYQMPVEIKRAMKVVKTMADTHRICKMPLNLIVNREQCNDFNAYPRLVRYYSISTVLPMHLYPTAIIPYKREHPCIAN